MAFLVASSLKSLGEWEIGRLALSLTAWLSLAPHPGRSKILEIHSQELNKVHKYQNQMKVSLRKTDIKHANASGWGSLGCRETNANILTPMRHEDNVIAVKS